MYHPDGNYPLNYIQTLIRQGRSAHRVPVSHILRSFEREGNIYPLKYSSGRYYMK